MDSPSSDSPRSLRIHPAKKLLFGLTLLVLCLGGIEVGARLLLPEPADSPLMIPDEGPGGGWKQAELHLGDPHLFWRNRPDVDILYKGLRVRTNRHGMRSDPVSVRKPTGVFRVLSLGESTSFGSKVGQDETYAAVLENLLGERHPEREFEVLNAGVPGWSLAQSYLYLLREGLSFEPDVVLLYHGFNDFLPTSFTTRRTEGSSGAVTDLALLDRSMGTMETFGQWLSDRSHAIRWLAHKMRSRKRSVEEEETVKVEDAGPSKDPASVRVPAEDRREILGRIVRLAEDHFTKLLVLIPCYRDFTEHRPLLLDFCVRKEAWCLDLEEAIDSLEADRSELFADSSHPRAVLHRKFAEVICDRIDRELLEE